MHSPGISSFRSDSLVLLYSGKIKNCPINRINLKIWPMYFMTECIREQLNTDFAGGTLPTKIVWILKEFVNWRPKNNSQLKYPVGIERYQVKCDRFIAQDCTPLIGLCHFNFHKINQQNNSYTYLHHSPSHFCRF